MCSSDLVNIKILNAGAWSRGAAGERLAVSLPRELEDFIPEVEDFYRQQHNGRKLLWLHQWSNGTVRLDDVPSLVRCPKMGEAVF